MRVAIVSHPDCLKHEMQVGHPERPGRIRAIDDYLAETGLDQFVTRLEAPLATRKQVLLAHDMAYLDFLFANVPQQGLFHVDPDTWMNPDSLNSALRAAGAVIEATDRVISGEFDRAFCNIRPPGHHAERGRGMGFCLINNIAVGAMHAIRQHRLERVAVVDFDVHHGNGSEQIVGDIAEILYCSTYQDPLYPGNTRESRHGLVCNVPLSPGSGSREFRHAVNFHWLPVLRDFRPQLLFISAGFDAHADDGIAQLTLDERDYAWVTEQLCEVADAFSDGRIVSALEGGYNLPVLARSAVAHIRALL